MIRAIRGATCVEDDSAKAIQHAVAELLSALLQTNRVESDQLVAVFFTLTSDLSALSPAKASRVAQGWTDVPLLCALEPDIQGLLPRCIRVMIQFESTLPRSSFQSIYLNGTQQLRPDLSQDSPSGA